MKRITALALALVLLLLLCACGTSDSAKTDEPSSGTADPAEPDESSDETPDSAETDVPSDGATETDAVEEPKMTKEEMLAEAVEVSLSEINEAYDNNSLRAAQQYGEKIFYLEGYALQITNKGFLFGDFGNAGQGMAVYLPEEDLINLEKNQRVSIVIKTGPDVFDLSQAYIVNERTEWICKLDSANESYKGAYNAKIGEDPYLKLVYFADGVEIPEMGTKVKLEGIEIAKQVLGGEDIEMRDARIVEILDE